MADTFNIAVTGMLAQNDKIAVIGNNIANSQTTGFKASDLSFTEEFVTHSGQFINGNHNQFGNGVRSAGVTTDWSAGSVEGTSNPSNVAIAGDGFLPVAYQGSVYYTRAGDFSLVEDPNTAGSYVFMRPNGAILLGGTGYDGSNVLQGLSVTSYVEFTGAPTSYEISADGAITQTGATALTNGFTGLQRFNNPDSLQRMEGGLYKTTSLTSLTTTSASKPGQNGCGTLFQGSLENSNTDLVSEFTNMIITQRAFQANAKTITTADEMLQTVLGLKR
jgi:flagellar hook protein FlgE